MKRPTYTNLLTYIHTHKYTHTRTAYARLRTRLNNQIPMYCNIYTVKE